MDWLLEPAHMSRMTELWILISITYLLLKKRK